MYSNSVLVTRGTPRKKVAAIAQEVIGMLSPHTSHLYTAGSYKRMASHCKDLEIVCLPLLQYSQETDLFGTRRVARRSPIFIERLGMIGDILKGNPATGRYVAIQHRSGLVIDVFMPMASDLYRILAIRTGPEEYARKLAARWSAMGWCGTTDGLRLIAECEQQGKVWRCKAAMPTLPPAWRSEEEFYQWLQLPYISPELRK